MTTVLLMNPLIKNLWERFAESKEYRENFVAAFVKKSIPSQIRTWMKKQGITTQQELAKRSGMSQGAISRAANPNYGDLTLNTIIKIGSGFDCVFVGKYVPYSEFCKMVIEDSFSEDADAMLSFQEEDKKLREEMQKAQQLQNIAEENYAEEAQLGASDEPWMKDVQAILSRLGEPTETEEMQKSNLGSSRKRPASAELGSADVGLYQKQRPEGVLHEAA